MAKTIRRTLVLHSGGLDSTVLLIKRMAEGDEVVSIGFDYNQRHARELEAAELVCAQRLIRRIQIRLPFLAGVRSSQTLGVRGAPSPKETTSAIAVPEGHYAAANMKATVVPNRNMIMLAAATSIALDEGFTHLVTAVHAGDHEIYPDCRPAFVAAMTEAIKLCDWGQVQLEAPFVNRSKAQIVALGSDLHVPFENTWTCYNGREKACGRCGTCVERLEAFDLAKVEDPLEYEDRNFWRQAVANIDEPPEEDHAR